MQLVGVVAALLLQLKAAPPAPTMPMPTPQQLRYMENELTMFIHFSVCTFNNGCHGGQQNCEGKGEASVPYVVTLLCFPQATALPGAVPPIHFHSADYLFVIWMNVMLCC